ncbi:uncharacterized protein EI97DRAFT_25219 [Westerdykella ornata]|uniref:Uncharacterized protein n=1 Tax=Westerdykella ornata TaxID=318751 RepID=A0A6A6JYW1_WESOR|nr:uncharacterized protein EI97DRAFT_25219 [Westerdykella ornata]KAF2281283.1 hypothetical protein EI97DRAFT_25219 [Westerdykella ornata]
MPVHLEWDCNAFEGFKIHVVVRSNYPYHDDITSQFFRVKMASLLHMTLPASTVPGPEIPDPQHPRRNPKVNGSNYNIKYAIFVAADQDRDHRSATVQVLMLVTEGTGRHTILEKLNGETIHEEPLRVGHCGNIRTVVERLLHHDYCFPCDSIAYLEKGEWHACSHAEQRWEYTQAKLHDQRQLVDSQERSPTNWDATTLLRLSKKRMDLQYIENFLGEAKSVLIPTAGEDLLVSEPEDVMTQGATEDAAEVATEEASEASIATIHPNSPMAQPAQHATRVAGTQAGGEASSPTPRVPTPTSDNMADGLPSGNGKETIPTPKKKGKKRNKRKKGKAQGKANADDAPGVNTQSVEPVEEQTSGSPKSEDSPVDTQTAGPSK